MRLSLSIESRWRSVPQEAVKLAERLSGPTQQIIAATSDLPREPFLDLYLHSEKQAGVLRLDSEVTDEDWRAWRNALDEGDHKWAIIYDDSPLSDGDYVKIASMPLAARRFLYYKQAADPTLNGALKGLGYLPGALPGAPSPLISALTSGMLGAGLGYGGGALAEWLLPETRDWNLKQRGALLGAGLGVAPSAYWMYENNRQGLPFYSGQLMRGEPYTSGKAPLKTETHLTDYLKTSAFGVDSYGGHPDYSFDAYQFNRTVWEDPQVANRLPVHTRAAATGLVSGAAYAKPQKSRLVSPLDVARVAAGMGSGYLSGALVGKTLGVLMGMPQPTQNKLKQTGMWAGVVANLMPLAFGSR